MSGSTSKTAEVLTADFTDGADGGTESEYEADGAEAAKEAGGVFAGESVLPDAEDVPPEGAERASDEAVAGAVGGEFFAPEGGVGFGRRGVERADVPSKV